MTLLPDTNVVSELRKPQPDRNVLAWYATVSSADLFLSVLTIGEIRLGIERLRRKAPAHAYTIEQWLRGLHAGYRDHLINVDAAVAEEWGPHERPRPLARHRRPARRLSQDPRLDARHPQRQ